MLKEQTKRVRYNMMKAQMSTERQSFEPDWRECGDYILSRRARFFVSDVNKGGRRNQKIIDSTASLAVRTLRSGMMAGITSPAREWKRLTTSDPDLAEYGPVKVWLNTVNERMSTLFERSNLYNVLPLTYGDMGVFGTAGIFMEEDMNTVSRFYSLPIGSYWIANDESLRVRVLVREFQMTVRQIVMKFGTFNWRTGAADWSNISEYVKMLWDRGEYEAWIKVCHVVHQNDEYEPDRVLSKNNKQFNSCYYEIGSSTMQGSNYLGKNDDDKYLRESGYDYFPGLFPRWEVTGEDVYGTDCPGLMALGDIKQLQHGEKRSAQAIDKKVHPPMTGPTSLISQKATILSGDITYLDVREGQQGFRATHEVDLSLKEHEEKQQQCRLRIQRVFYEDLFLMMAQSDRREITAREIDERHEEKLLALGPVLEQLNQDLLDPLIDNQFNFMIQQSMDANGNFIDGAYIPRPPKELQKGMNNQLKVEYISNMAQAQKLVGIANIERFTAYIGTLCKDTASLAPFRKVNIDQMIDRYADRLSIDPDIIRSDDEVDEIAAAEAQQQKAVAMQQALQTGAGAAKDLSQADLEKDSALKRIVEQSTAGELVPQTA